MKNTSTYLHFILLFSLLSSPITYASISDPVTEETQIINRESGQWWLNLAEGIGSGGKHSNFGGISTEASFNYRLSEHQLITARYLDADSVFLGALLGPSQFTDVGLMYGGIAKNKYAYISASAGLGLARYDKYSDIFSNYHHVGTYNTLGIPGEIQAFLTPFPYVGLGIILFGDINNKRSIGGAALALQVGDLR